MTYDEFMKTVLEVFPNATVYAAGSQGVLTIETGLRRDGDSVKPINDVENGSPAILDIVATLMVRGHDAYQAPCGPT